MKHTNLFLLRSLILFFTKYALKRSLELEIVSIEKEKINGQRKNIKKIRKFFDRSTRVDMHTSIYI